MLVPWKHHGCGIQRARQAHIQISPADQRKIEGFLAIKLQGLILGIGLSARDGGQQRCGQIVGAVVHFLFQRLQDGGHFTDADGLEQILVHAGLDSALGVFKLAVSADDDDMDIGLHGAGRLGQLDAVHTAHADIGNQ